MTDSQTGNEKLNINETIGPRYVSPETVQEKIGLSPSSSGMLLGSALSLLNTSKEQISELLPNDSNTLQLKETPERI